MRKALAPVGATVTTASYCPGSHAGRSEGECERGRQRAASRSHCDPRFVRLCEELNSLNAAIDLNGHRRRRGVLQAASTATLSGVAVTEAVALTLKITWTFTGTGVVPGAACGVTTMSASCLPAAVTPLGSTPTVKNVPVVPV